MWWTLAIFVIALVALEYALGLYVFFVSAKMNRQYYYKHMIERHLSVENWRLAQYFIIKGQRNFPNASYFTNMRGLLAYRKNLFIEAIDAFESAKALDAQNVDLDNIMGDTYIQLKRYDEAKICLDRFLLANPEHINTRLNLAVAEFHTHHFEGAMRLIDQVLSLDPYQVLAYKIKGNVLIKLNRWGDALETFKHYQKIGGDDPKVHGQMLRIYRNLEDYEACKVHAESLLSKGYDDAVYYTLLGDALCHLGKIQKGIAMLNQAVLIDEHQSEAHYLLAKLMAMMHHKSEALDHLRRAIADYPKYRKLALEDEDFNNLRFFRDFYRLVGECSL